tara:strand:- start:61 stop:570 length:510 start_codon:yes stop_codon:yes gene_type:complete
MQVYDNFLSSVVAHEAYEFVLKSYYKIGWEDSLEPEQRVFPNLHSIFSKEDVEKLNILGPVNKKIKDQNLIYEKCIVNLTKPLDVNFVHVHPNQVVALYYANMNWKTEDGGETIFYKDNRKDILLASPYVPNRLIIFDGSTPHTITSQSILGPTYRFTISLFFNKGKKR